MEGKHNDQQKKREIAGKFLKDFSDISFYVYTVCISTFSFKEDQSWRVQQREINKNDLVGWPGTRECVRGLNPTLCISSREGWQAKPLGFRGIQMASHASTPFFASCLPSLRVASRAFPSWTQFICIIRPSSPGWEQHEKALCLHSTFDCSTYRVMQGERRGEQVWEWVGEWVGE